MTTWGRVVRALEPGDPRQVGKYRLLGRLGSGGMGRVFLGQSPGGRLVAVKLIREDLATDEDFRARFVREVKLARNVSGMFTAPMVDADPKAPQPWLVTAYVPGPSLADAVGVQGPLPVSSLLKLAAGLAEGLGAIHAGGVVHRDLKPSNVLLAGDGPRIIDFGISRAADASALTAADLIVGSPGFMSPEQAKGLEVGSAADVFSLGSVLAFAATGEGPFGTGPGTALLYRVVHTEPDLGGLPTQIRPLVERCLAKDPDRRPDTDQILAELGSPDLAGGWLPASLSQLLQTYQASSPSPSAGSESRAGRTPSREREAASLSTAASDLSTVTSPSHSLPEKVAALRQAADGSLPRLYRPWRWHLSRVRIAALLVAILAVTATAVALTSQWSSSGGQGSASPGNRPGTSATAAVPSPRTVVKAFYAAINDHNWPRVWHLGGKNLGRSYHAMVDGFRLTSRDVVTRLTANGSTVWIRFRAHETTGAVQTYKARYVVRHGIITSGHQTLLATSYPPTSQHG